MLQTLRMYRNFVLMDSDINIRFGKVIASKRKAIRISQEELAFRCGMHRTYIGAIERGEKSPTLATIEKLSNGLKTSILDLWEALKTD